MKSSDRAVAGKDQQNVVTEFLHSDTQKIFMLIGAERPLIRRFFDQALTAAANETQNKVLRYEFLGGEHPRHFLFRWLWDTVSGEAFCGNGDRSATVESGSQLPHHLRLLIEKDIRPLEIRFVEAIRFIARDVPAGQKVLLSFLPQSSLQDKSLLEFFQNLLRALPLNVKMLIGQHEDDVLARQTDFCPTNRLVLEAAEGLEGIAEKYRVCAESGSTAGGLLHILAALGHPTAPGLLARLSGENEDSVDRILRSPELEDLVEPVSRGAFRLKYPHAFSGEGTQWDQPADLLGQALDYYEQRLIGGDADYRDVLGHSLCLHQVEDVAVLARRIHSSAMAKLRMGGGDICELEIGRALSLPGGEQPRLKAGLLLRLGEVREARQHNREAMEALAPAIETLRDSGDIKDLQYALELMGRAAFGVRDMEAGKKAFDESLLTARQLGQDSLTAGLLSQIGYLHFSTKQLDEAEKFYRESLELYEKIAQTGEKEGLKGTAAQWSNLGHIGYARGDFETAESFHRKALDAYTSLGEVQSRANQWGYLGHTFFAAHSYEKAIEAYEQAAELEESLGKPERAAQRYASVGHSMYAQRNVELARTSFQKAFDKYTLLGNAEGQAAQLSNLGLVAGDQGEYESAVDYFNRAAALYREMQDAFGETTQFARLAQVYRAQKLYDEAIRQYEPALSRYREIGYPMGEGEVLLEIGSLYCENKDWQKGRESFDGARALFANIGHREKEALCLIMIAYSDKGAGRTDAAMSVMQQALELYKQDENSLGIANVTSQMGLLHFEQQRFEEAERLYREALELFRAKEDIEGQANLLSNLGTVYYSQDELNKASQHYQEALSLLRKLNHPSGIAGLLVNFSFVCEKEGKLDEAGAQLKEAREIYEHLHATDQLSIIDRRIGMLEQKAADSLKRMRAELTAAPPLKNKTAGKVGVNAPCPCGSGKKYKKCCGQ